MTCSFGSLQDDKLIQLLEDGHALGQGPALKFQYHQVHQYSVDGTLNVQYRTHYARTHLIFVQPGSCSSTIVDRKSVPEMYCVRDYFSVETSAEEYDRNDSRLPVGTSC